jgi:flavin-dependent dehydrogenase
MQTITEKAKQTPVTSHCGVLVAGGGIAGISAALSAARSGSDVLLIERECLLGGLSTLGLITIYLPLCDGMGNQVSFGIAEELLRLSIKHVTEDRHPDAWLNSNDFEKRKKQRFQVQYNPHLFALEVEKLLLSEGVRILYNTFICDTIVENSKITHIIVENKSGRSAIGVKSVVDATGDADICYMSGESTTTFKPGNELAAWYYSISKDGVNLEKQGFADIPNKYKTENYPKPLMERKFSGLDGFENSEMLCLSHE